MAWKASQSEVVWPEIEAAESRSTVSPEEQVEKHYEIHSMPIYRYLCMLGVPPENADELCQECFLSLFHCIQRREKIRSVRAWLFKVAHNRALNFLAVERGRDCYKAEWLDAAVEQHADGQASPEQQVIERERFERIQGALASLSPQQRACLCLRAEGLRYREIAEAMGIGISSVQEFLRRAIERLKELSL